MGNTKSAHTDLLRSLEIGNPMNEQQAKAIWNKYDTNSDGSLDKSEVEQFVAEYVQVHKITEDPGRILEAFMHTFDTNGDGCVDFGEVTKTVKQYKGQGRNSLGGGVTDPSERMFRLMGLLYKPHPWHGLTIGLNAPEIVSAYIECCPGEGIKYEVDKDTGYLKVDRPHKYSSMCPTIYGFLPQTYCGPLVAQRCMEKTGLPDIVGDQDPIDICVLSTRMITHGDLILDCRPIGGLRMIDGGEADDKIIAVVKGDPVMSSWEDVTDIPKPHLDLLRHYFLTYKQSPESMGESKDAKVLIPEVYGREEAYEMIKRSQNDYTSKYAELKAEFSNSVLLSIKKGIANSIMGI